MASVAERMHWASKRQATRPEDIAYSLLGLFDVNMPLLYGESGPKAFRRLQMEIIKASDDESVFAWAPGDKINGPTGLLATSIDQFVYKNIVSKAYQPRLHYEVTNKGVKVDLTLPRSQLKDTFRKSPHVEILMPLNCAHFLYQDGQKESPVAIRVRLFQPGPGDAVRYLEGHWQDGGLVRGDHARGISYFDGPSRELGYDMIADYQSSRGDKKDEYPVYFR